MKDKIVVITGASRGLGKALVDTLTFCGAHVVASSIDSVENKADVRNEQDLKKLAADSVKKFGRIDIWINNAGVWLPRMPVEELDMNRVRELFDVNVFGTINGCRAALTIMKKQGNGTIVNIISTSALTARPLSAAYSASKHAEKGLSDSLREEVRPHGIRVIGVYPGGMKTALFDEKKPDDFNEYMEVEPVVRAIIDNLEKDSPQEELIIKRPGQNL
jgi:NAD(P)-dependent dehydrogenase (short-subunit alcohol dehydrogenase family)